VTMITLLAMAPSGETFITRHGRGRVWLHQPEGAGGAGPIADTVVERAVADHGFDRIDQDFETWAALDEFRQARAARVTPPVVVDRDALDLDDVRWLIGVGERWRAKGEGARARRLVLELMRVPAVLGDAESHELLVTCLEQVDEPPIVVASAPSSPLKARAQERWQVLQNAA